MSLSVRCGWSQASHGQGSLPVTTWWPAANDPCPCDACDQPHLTDSDIADALPPHDDCADLTIDQLNALADAA
jgi:hypothetical protein